MICLKRNTKLFPNNFPGYPCPKGYYCPAGTAGDNENDANAGLRCPRGKLVSKIINLFLDQIFSVTGLLPYKTNMMG